MRFMIVSDTFPPDINGVARTLQTWARGLAKRGHDVQVITTTEDAGAENAPFGVKVSAVAALPMPGYDGIRLGMVSRAQMLGHMQRQGTDSMYVAVETPMGLNAIRAAKDAGVPVVSGFHTNFHTYSRDYRLPILRDGAAWYLKHIHNRTSRTLTPSETTAQQLRELGINNVGVVGRGVDTEKFNPGHRDAELRRSWGADDTTPVALFVGRIAAEKNLPLAVKAFEEITRIHPRAKMVFVGDGPKAASLKADYPQFVHAGARTGHDLARHYASADLFVFPSLSETFGNVLVEALASGLVTVSFDYAAARQVVQNRLNGFVAPVDDERAYLEAAALAALHWSDTALRNAALEAAKLLSWDTIIEQFERELQSATVLSATAPKTFTPHDIAPNTPSTTSSSP